jgi:phage baseplate assembly protein W
MPLDIPINITEIDNDSEAIPTKTYKIDFENGRIIGKVDEIEAIKQFIKKALKTPRFKCLIYDGQYGSEIDNLIKSDSTFQFIESELPRVVEDALIYDKRIQKVYDFSFELSKEQLYIKFKVDTIYGTTEYEEVI